MRQGNCKAGYAVTATDKVNEAKPLAVGTSAQKAEITRNLKIWTDAKYACVYGTHSWYHLERARVAYTQGKQIQRDVNLPKSSIH